jgi:succinoglycan biosynthesis transport protein ExoP
MSDKNGALAPEVFPPPAKHQKLDHPVTTDHVDGYRYDYGYGDYDDGSGLDYSLLHKWWRAVTSRKWLVIAITLVATTAISLEMFRIRSTYQAYTLIEIRKENTSVVKSGDQIIANDDSLKTRAFVLQSTPLLEDVIVNLKLDENPKMVDTGNRSLGEILTSMFDKPRSPSEMQIAQPVPEMKMVERSSALSPEESERLEPIIDAVKKNLTIEEIKDTRLLKVSFVHPDPTIAASFCNGVAENFIQRNLESKTDKFTKVSDWLDRATHDFKDRVKKAEESLANYTNEHGIFSTGSGENLAIEKLARLHGEVMKAETDRMVKASLYEEVRHGRVAQVPEAFSDPTTVALQKKLGELEVMAAQLSVNYGPENPQTLEVKQQIAAIQKQTDANHKILEEKFKTDYERAVRDEGSFKTALEMAKVEALQQNQAAVQYNILKQELDTAKSLYTTFLQKTDQANFEVVQQQNNVRVIEPARVPKLTMGPNRWQTITLGLFLSLAASVGLVLILEFLDNSIKNTEDLSRYVQLPALGVIPTVNSGRQRWFSRKNKLPEYSPGQLMTLDHHSIAAEAYRVLRTSMVRSTAARSSKSVLVTSTQPGDGKTTTVVNAAISLAQLGASVLIIDCDLRTPTVHKVLGVEQGKGLSTYFSSEVEIGSLIQKLEIPNLSLLPCGPIPINPTEIIGSEKMKDMLAILTGRFDHILIDSPPMINLADPILLSTLVEGVLLVVQGGRSSRHGIRRARQELSSAGANVFGVVLNKVNFERYGESYY